MTKHRESKNHHDEMAKKIGAKSSRKLKAKRHQGKKTWFGLGMMGLVGWSITIPTLLGVLIGVWIDSTVKTRYAWTLMLMVTGLAIGCLNVWYWLGKEAKEIKDDEEDQDE